MIAQLVNGSPVEVTGQIELEGEVFVSLASVLLWSEPERNAAGLYTVIDPAPPQGKVVASYGALGFAAGVVTREPNYRDAPPPPRRLLPKSVVQERVNDIGKLAAVMAVLRSAGQEISYARWFAPDWPNVYADDAAMLGLLAAVGLSPAQIATVTAE